MYIKVSMPTHTPFNFENEECGLELQAESTINLPVFSLLNLTVFESDGTKTLSSAVALKSVVNEGYTLHEDQADFLA